MLITNYQNDRLPKLITQLIDYQNEYDTGVFIIYNKPTEVNVGFLEAMGLGDITKELSFQTYLSSNVDIKIEH